MNVPALAPVDREAVVAALTELLLAALEAEDREAADVEVAESAR